MSLEELYGPCCAAQRSISAAEEKFIPQSLQVFDSSTAPFLKAYMDTVTGLRLPGVLHSYCAILWLINQDGQTLFALEEVVDEETGEPLSINIRGSRSKVEGAVKLGHPSLLGEVKDARIGGEIVYNFDESRWEINNFSGRYGTRPHQTLSHLQAAADVFKVEGIQLEPVFSA